jgi:glycosyltransferase involved in cell wall biosynthesis
MKNLKFELAIAYYKRPKIVLNALESIKNSTYSNWHLTFIDDSGDDSFRDTFLNFGFDNSKINYVPIMMSDEEKLKNNGSNFGKYVNDSIINSDADIFILICDDDALTHDYMEKLNIFYNKNPKEVWSYCHLNFYNPDVENYTQSKEICVNPSLNGVNLNAHFMPINPYCRVDSSQVSFRIDSLIEKNIFYPYPYTVNLDAFIFNNFYNVWGNCPFNGIVGQHKGWFENQLGVRHRAGKGDFIK